ncbi:hypothetical protein ACL02O_17170 [Micromonospora sp. MS34]|uniref:hypothetical protein n=1 Tax=Micromonospora sp. MS34 TaxID=3385971 RepID=UPI0039A139A0
MSEEFERLFGPLRGQQPPRPFALPEAVRRRGRQRSQHRALATGLALVAVVGAGVGGATYLAPADHAPGPAASQTGMTAPPARTSTPAASPSAARTAVPDPGPMNLSTLLLRPQDLGPGRWQERRPTEPFSGDTWHWADLCAGYRSADYPSLRHQADVAVTGYATGSTDYLDEHLHRYGGGWGPKALDDVRRVLTTCHGAPPSSGTSGGPAPDRYTVVASGFAGDEALLVREEQWYYDGDTLAPDPRVTLTAVVRVGDLVGTVMFAPDRDEAYAKAVAAAAADRLAGGR